MTRKPLLIAAIAFAGLALLSMLAYNFWHTGGLLAHYVEPGQLGYVAAFGIEVAVVGLAIAIGTRRLHGMSTSWFWAVLVLVLIVSFMANVSEGHLTRYKNHITQDTVQEIDLLQGVIGLAATGLISVIVMAMSEIIGQYTVQLATQEEEGQPQVSSKGHKSAADLIRGY